MRVCDDLSQVYGARIIPAVTAKPQVFAKVVERVRKWVPKAPPGYTPGYEFTERISEKDAHKAVHAARTEYLKQLSDLSTLLYDPDYFAAFRVLQAYNLASEEKPPPKEAYKQATETMRRIEKAKGIKGIPGK